MPQECSLQKIMFGGLICSQFCWRQHFFTTPGPKIPKMTSRDVTWSDFQQNFQKCFFPLYLTCVQTWSHLDVYIISYDKFTFTCCSYRHQKIWRHLVLTKCQKFPSWTWNRPQIITKCVKLNFSLVKIAAGLRPAPFFHTPKFYGWGVILPPPNQNRVKEEIATYWVITENSNLRKTKYR